MQTITIPQKITKQGELIVVPRKEYERLLGLGRFYDALDRDLDKAILEYKIGKGYGPFRSVEEGKKFLASGQSNKKRG